MSLLQGIEAVANSSGNGPVDWTAVGEAARAVTNQGSLQLSEHEIEAYRKNVQDAHTRIQHLLEGEFELPETIEIQNRHHWIDANITTFQRVMQPVEVHWKTVFPDASRKINTATMSIMMSYLGRNVLGQYDPILLAEHDEEHALYFVHPNIINIATELDVNYDRFLRWITFHEIAHAAEFGAAPWLSGHLESRLADGIDALASGKVDREAFRDLDSTMTVVEGFAELVMDRAFDQEYLDLRQKLDERRRNAGPVSTVIRRVLGLDVKRRQYERGKRFFDVVVEKEGIETASLVWVGPEFIPSRDEINNPSRWIDRVNAEGR